MRLPNIGSSRRGKPKCGIVCRAVLIQWLLDSRRSDRSARGIVLWNRDVGQSGGGGGKQGGHTNRGYELRDFHIVDIHSKRAPSLRKHTRVDQTLHLSENQPREMHG